VSKSCSYSSTTTGTTTPTTPTTPTAPAATWTTCANEGGTCSVSGTREVRYGAKDKFVSKVVTGSVACNNSVFGDPIGGVSKTCSYSSVTK
jgi:serine protease